MSAAPPRESSAFTRPERTALADHAGLIGDPTSGLCAELLSLDNRDPPK
ncbi:hypothetical protein [Micromonospora peucetia]|nr:hypothetical protein [Micromonospora peucetia]